MITHEVDDFEPPTVPLPTSIHTYSNYSEIPSSLLECVNDSDTLKIMIGINEADRGPII